MTARRFSHIVFAAFLTLGLGAVACGCDKEDAPSQVPDCMIEPGQLPTPSWTSAPPAKSVESVEATADGLSVITPYPRYRWDRSHHNVESVDGSVGFHGLVVGPAAHAAARLQVAVLVDYGPAADATITLRDGRREETLLRENATGLVRTIEGRAAVAIDIELPAGTVPHGRWREVQTVVEWGPVDGPSDVVDVRRWTVRAGTRPPVARTCAPAAGEVLSAAEVELTRAGGVDSLLYPSGPTLQLAVRTKKAPTVAWVALVDGRPAGDARFVRGATGDRIAARQAIETAPGATTFVPVWSQPYQPEAPAISNFLSSNVAHLPGSQSTP